MDEWLAGRACLQPPCTPPSAAAPPRHPAIPPSRHHAVPSPILRAHPHLHRVAGSSLCSKRFDPRLPQHRTAPYRPADRPHPSPPGVQPATPHINPQRMQAFVILVAVLGGAAGTETDGSARPTSAGIHRSGSNLELTTPGSIICNGLDVVRISICDPAFRSSVSIPTPGTPVHRSHAIVP